MRERVARASRAAGVSPEQLAPVRLTQYRQVLARMLDTFTTFGTQGQDRRWLWEGFKGPTLSLPVEVGQRWLPRLVPPRQRVWFVTEDWDGEKKDGNFWVFEGEVGSVQAVLDELPPFEYYVVDKDYIWLLCENHHNLLIGVGQPIVERLAALAGG